MLYENRKDAGRKLADKLKIYKSESPIIIAIPRGGVVIGYEVSKILHAPLDVVVPRKIGAPSNPEFGIGAIAPNDVRVFDAEIIKLMGIPQSQIDEIVKSETAEMFRRTELYRKELPTLDLKGKTVIVVDDGIATGVSTKAAILYIKKMHPKKIILAVPVCPQGVEEIFLKEVDDFLCILQPSDFYAVGAHYIEFNQVNDYEVIDLLEKAKDFL